MASVGVQLYTLRNVDEPLPRVLERVADAGFDGVEFAYRVHDADRDALVETMDETGLDAAGAHVPLDRLEDDREATLDLFDALGCDALTVPGVEEEHFADAESVADLAARLDDVGAALADRGFALGYHNHDFEFGTVEGTTALEALFARTEHVRPQVDLGLTRLAGEDPVRLLDSLGTVPQVHVKDLDLAACADAFAAAEGEWAVYEYEGEDPLGSLDAAADAVSDLF
jgi:sugar phosphate isomerase/epimerase